jgi:hypothetical protein
LKAAVYGGYFWKEYDRVLSAGMDARQAMSVALRHVKGLGMSASEPEGN